MSDTLVLRGYMPRERAATSALFLMNGYIVGNWAPKIPLFKAALGIDEAMLGLLILAFGIGSLAFMPVVGAIIAREGSRRVLLALAVASAPMLLVLTLVPGVWTAAAALVVLGGLVGGTDVAMNASAVSVERRMRRAIMSSCHAWWSLGGLIGAASGGLMLAHLSPVSHAVVVAGVALVLIAAAAPAVIRDLPAPSSAGGASATGLPRTLLPWLIGIMALFSMIPEGAILDWSALYLREGLGASVEGSALAFAGFSATMAVMRFTGDPIRDRLGAVTTLRISTVVAGIGMLGASLAPTAGLAAAGFAVAGLGIANMVPIAFSAAGNLPGLAPGIGLSVVTFMGYSGLLFAPSLIGFVAQHTGLGSVFLALPTLYIVVFALSGLVRHADALGGHTG